MNNKYIAEGTVAFQSLREHDVWQGQSTGKYTLTLGLPEDIAEILQTNGVKLKDYEGTAQRKFVSQYNVPILNEDGSPFEGDVTQRIPCTHCVQLWQASPRTRYVNLS